MEFWTVYVNVVFVAADFSDTYLGNLIILLLIRFWQELLFKRGHQYNLASGMFDYLLSTRIEVDTSHNNSAYFGLIVHHISFRRARKSSRVGGLFIFMHSLVALEIIFLLGPPLPLSFNDL